MYWFQNILSNQYLVRDFTGCYEVVVSKCTAFLRSRSRPQLGLFLTTWLLSDCARPLIPSSFKNRDLSQQSWYLLPFPYSLWHRVQLTLGNGDRRQTQHVPFPPWFESLLLKISECIKHFSKLHPNSSLRYCLHINKTPLLPSLLLQHCSGCLAHTKLKIKIT